jgi:hypothetical protein
MLERDSFEGIAVKLPRPVFKVPNKTGHLLFPFLDNSLEFRVVVVKSASP